jgi:nucleotide-binding universal stress UspA family protein
MLLFVGLGREAHGGLEAPTNIMKRLLIAYDGSPCAESVLDDLPSAGLPAEMEAAIISVADVWLPANPGGEPPSFPEPMPEAVRKARAQALAAVENARALASRASDRLRILFPKWKVETFACADSPAWGVLTKASEWKADLVALGSHGRSTLERLFLGSVSQKVAVDAACSVRIVRSRKHQHHSRLRVVVGVDGSPDGMGAVRSVASRVWPQFSVFHIVAVMDSRLETAVGWPDVYPAQWLHAQDSSAKEAVCRMLEHAARLLHDAGLKVETHLSNGDPKRELLAHAEAWEADTIFLGARGLHHGGRLALGTTASAVAARAHCSVEIARPG